MRRALVAVLLAVLALALTSRFWPTVERIEVVGARHYGQTDVLRIAKVAPGDPLLWVTRWRVAGLDHDPWIARARVTRHWPDAVSIAVWERTPQAVSRRAADATVWSADGTVLPGATPAERAGLPVVNGWGADRLVEALELVILLKDRQPEVIQYTPEGFEIALSDALLFTPDIESLRRQWAAVERHRGGRLAVYPWGVSRTDE